MEVKAMLLAACLMLFALPAVAASGTTTKSGVYTESQANSGKALYTQKCQMCHGSTLQNGSSPHLAGSQFLGQWGGQTVGDLYTKIHDTMPATAPGTLSPTQTVDLISYILQQNKMPAGSKALPSNPGQLKTIHIAK